jgi:hypothetical protein
MTPVDGAPEANVVLHRAVVETARPPSDFTPRVVPWHPAARGPAEAGPIRWPR